MVEREYTEEQIEAYERLVKRYADEAKALVIEQCAQIGITLRPCDERKLDQWIYDFYDEKFQRLYELN